MLNRCWTFPATPHYHQLPLMQLQVLYTWGSNSKYWICTSLLFVESSAFYLFAASYCFVCHHKKMKISFTNWFKSISEKRTFHKFYSSSFPLGWEVWVAVGWRENEVSHSSDQRCRITYRTQLLSRQKTASIWHFTVKNIFTNFWNCLIFPM